MNTSDIVKILYFFVLMKIYPLSNVLASKFAPAHALKSQSKCVCRTFFLVCPPRFQLRAEPNQTSSCPITPNKKQFDNDYRKSINLAPVPLTTHWRPSSSAQEVRKEKSNRACRPRPSFLLCAPQKLLNKTAR